MTSVFELNKHSIYMRAIHSINSLDWLIFAVFKSLYSVYYSGTVKTTECSAKCISFYFPINGPPVAPSRPTNKYLRGKQGHWRAGALHLTWRPAPGCPFRWIRYFQAAPRGTIVCTETCMDVRWSVTTAIDVTHRYRRRRL